MILLMSDVPSPVYEQEPAGEEVETAPPPFALRRSAFLWGTQSSITTPMTALLLSKLYNATNGQIATVIFCYNVVAIFWSWFVPRWADRHRNYLGPMVLSSVCTLIMCTSLFVVPSLLIAAIFLVGFGSWAFIGNAMLFAYARHTGTKPREIVTMRSMVSLSWVLGAPIGTFVIAAAGGKALVGLIVAIAVGNITVTSQLMRHRVPVSVLPREKHKLGANKVGVAFLFFGFSFMQTAMSAATSITALFTVRTLHTSTFWGGAALGLAAGLEVPALLWLRKAVLQRSQVRLLGLAAVAGVGYYVLMASSLNGYEILVLQVLNAIFVATYLAVRLIIFQRVVSLPGAAMGLQTNSGLVGALLTGPVIAASTLGTWGLRTVFLLCGTCVVLGMTLVALSQHFTSPPSARG